MSRIGTAPAWQRELEVDSIRRARARFQDWSPTTRVLVVLLVLAIVPVPWMHVVDDNPPGSAWRLDGRLVVEGEVIDPAGRWSWLTVGRPPVLAEVARGWLVGGEDQPRDLRNATTSSRPDVNEPAAAAVGLLMAGHDVRFGLIVEATGPHDDERYPHDVRITSVNGVELTDRSAWKRAISLGTDPVWFTTEDGGTYIGTGPLLPYERIDVVDVAPDDLEAAIAGKIARAAPVDWFRGLALGRSHGLMVALVTYAHAADPDLADGRHIAGTGGIQGDGTVTRIGGLRAKAAAARDAGADVMIFPAVQAGDLEDFEPGGMDLVPVLTLEDAIDHLAATRQR